MKAVLDMLARIDKPPVSLSDNISSQVSPINDGVSLFSNEIWVDILTFDYSLLVDPPLAIELGRFFDALNQISSYLSTATAVLGESPELLQDSKSCAAFGVLSNDVQSGPDILHRSHSVKVAPINLNLLKQHCEDAAQTVDRQKQGSAAQQAFRSLSSLQNALTLLIVVPIISGAARDLQGTLQTLGDYLDAYTGCYRAGLSIMADGLSKVKDNFTGTDARLITRFAYRNSQP